MPNTWNAKIHRSRSLEYLAWPLITLWGMEWVVWECAVVADVAVSVNPTHPTDVQWNSGGLDSQISWMLLANRYAVVSMAVWGNWYYHDDKWRWRSLQWVECAALEVCLSIRANILPCICMKYVLSVCWMTAHTITPPPPTMSTSCMAHNAPQRVCTDIWTTK